MAMLTHVSAGWEIRPHSRDDHTDIERVFSDCLYDFPWRDALKELEALHYSLRNASVLVASEPQAGVVGFLILHAGTRYFSHLFVERDWRLCGIAQGLLQVARGVAGGPLQLDVDTLNESAIATYRKLGWTEMVEHGRLGYRQTRFQGP